MKVIAVANQKGGVGKTTTSVNLGAALAAVGKKVLLIDFDPQGNASTGLGIDNRQKNIYSVLSGVCTFQEALVNTEIPYFFLIPATQDLAAAEIELAEVDVPQLALKQLLQTIPEDLFDYVFIDCPPALGLLTINGLAAATSVLIPLQTEFYAMEGMTQLMKNVEAVKEHFNKSLQVEGIVLTMHDSRNRLTQDVESQVRTHYKNYVYQAVIPRNVRISESPSHGQPIIIYDLKSVGSYAYLSLAKEFINRSKQAA